MCKYTFWFFLLKTVVRDKALLLKDFEIKWKTFEKQGVSSNPPPLFSLSVYAF